MFGAIFQHIPEYVFKTENWIFQMPDPTGWVQGKWSYMVTWFWINEVLIIVIVVFGFSHGLKSVKYWRYKLTQLPWGSISLQTNFNIIKWNLT